MKKLFLFCALSLLTVTIFGRSHELSEVNHSLKRQIGRIERYLACKKKRTRILATYFVKRGSIFVRALTSLTKPNGQLDLGSAITQGAVYDKLINGQAFRGNIVLFGKNYFAQYVPLKNTQNQVIGAVGSARPI